ncbi:DUF6691 family protein [Pendulispora albinea]|uniref:YeeE/YedE family protein n=1 Tax=Pendulispora albinea TaxID=2741071 RepID=A0ABZ2LT03_9BACT
MKKMDAAAFVAGFVFAIGLGIAQMTQPAKVLGFLDIAGAWDPSLAFVMIGAIAVHFVFVRLAKKAARPRLADVFHWPRATTVDRRLVTGAALFGVGWGISGFCPGPALVSVVSLAPSTLAFVFAMVGGMIVQSATPRAEPKAQARANP